MAQPTIARFRRGSVAVKTETTYATDASLAAADIVEARNIVFKANQDQFVDERQSGLLLTLPDIPGARSATLSFEVLLRGAAAAYSATVRPEVDAILQALGFSSTGDFTVGLEKYTYVPESGATIGASVTAALFAENAPQGKLLGAFGTGRIVKQAGEPAVLAVTLTGLYVAPADVALITAAPVAIQPPVFKSGAVTIGAVTHRIQSLEIDIGNDVQLVPDANDVQAIAAAFIAGRRFGATLDPEQVTVAIYDWHGKRDAGTLDAFSWNLGSVQYNKATFSGPKFQVLDLAEGNRNGIRTFGVTAKLNPDVGSDELSIVFD